MSKAKKASHSIEFKAETDGVSKMMPADLHSFVFDIKCTQCGALRQNVRFEDEEISTSGSRGTFSFVMNCKDCKRQCTISYVKSNLEAEFSDYSEWRQFLTVDCRGCQIENVHCDDWKIESESSNTYEWNGADDFFEYDEDLEKPVTVSDFSFRVVGIK
ncbi:DUF866-domain-containing protein [Histomonas meleagridis]|uniref:DUF866-domain-containing protein n=1 Tax=Histomonas meleagridis TaxID=135588 RepID=UPI00355A3760|nr:DUF866-domain-containing protein [Histomonas meleagridis]KAH0807063.1 DUF866-domain-containing protein [Histomonas meleagridis]